MRPKSRRSSSACCDSNRFPTTHRRRRTSREALPALDCASVSGRRSVAAIAAITCFALAGSSQALAAQRYASPSGSGSACTQVSPCPIDVAAINASTGDEVIVAPGDYSPPGNVTLAVNNVYLHGADGQPAPRIHFTGGFLWIAEPGDRASRVIVDGTSGGPVEVGKQAEADQILAHASGSSAAACFVYGTLVDSVCWSSDSNGRGVEAESTLMNEITLRNDTLVAPGATGRGLSITTDSGGVITLNVANVIARGGANDIFLNQVGASDLIATIDHSNYATISNTGAELSETSRQTAAPSFVDAAAGDFREAPGSPTIGAGVNSPANGSFDLQGFPRVINGTTDIGAYEFDPFAGVTIDTRKTKVKKGRARVRVTCPASAPPPCAGTLKLTFALGYSTAGFTTFSLQPGVSQTMKLKITKKARKRISRKGKLGTQAAVIATDGAATSVTTTRTIKLTG